jgi:two-component system sensor histidine kinase PilS (NtrC family)
MTPIDGQRLLRGVFWARLGVAALLLPLGTVLPDAMMPGINHGVLVLSLLTVVTSSGGLLLGPPLAHPRRIAWLVALLDVALVTAVVAATGGARSIFTFLYVMLVTASCVTLSRTGGLTIAAAASALYTALVFGHTVLPLTFLFEAPQETTALEIMTMFANAGTFLVVAIVAGGLAERFQIQSRTLRDLRAIKDLVFESVGTGLIALDRSHIITTFNRAATTITGVPAAAAIGRPWAALFGNLVSLPAIEAELAAERGASSRHEAVLSRPGGGRVPVRLTFWALTAGDAEPTKVAGGPWITDDGEPLGVICACEDLTAIRVMEERLRQADRLATLGRMSANIAHEIRNPLASLTGAIEVLASSGTAGEVRERLAQIVLKESGRLNDILRDFLEYARPAPLQRARTNVIESIDEVLVLLEHRAAVGTLKIAREFAPSLEWVVDPQQFRQAVWNLCLNAVQAMPDGGELRVLAAVTGGQLEVRVSDTGEGIAHDNLSHVFEPFFSTKSDGSGLGLALVHRVMQDHGGDVRVESAPGAGSVFTLRFPAIRG